MSQNHAKPVYSVAEFCQAAGISRSLFYEEVARGRITVVKVGRRTLIRAEEISSWLDRLANGQSSDA